MIEHLGHATVRLEREGVDGCCDSNNLGSLERKDAIGCPARMYYSGIEREGFEVCCCRRHLSGLLSTAGVATCISGAWVEWVYMFAMTAGT